MRTFLEFVDQMEGCLRPESMPHGPDVRKAQKNVPIFVMTVEKGAQTLPRNIFDPMSMMLNTLEGPMQCGNQDYLAHDQKKAYWVISKDQLDDYLPIDNPCQRLASQGWDAVMPNQPVRAWKVKRPFRVRTRRGIQESEPNGGMMVQKLSDPDDVWIVNFDGWNNYNVLE
jgi:hypothetical protein